MKRPTVMAANMAGIIYSVETLLQYGLKPDENLVFLARLITCHIRVLVPF